MKKTKITRLISGFLVVGFCLGLTGIAGAQNLLTNPGFEDGTTNGWFSFGSCSLAATTAQAHSGSYSCLVTGRTDTWNGPAQDVMSIMSPDNVYNISVWVRLENASNDSAKVTFRKVDDSGTSYPQSPSTMVYNNQWTSISWTFTLTVSGTLSELVLYIEGPQAGVNYYIDDASVEWAGTAGDWETEANNRIEQIRKRDAQITVVDALGSPIPDVEVQIDQTKHQFAFGCVINYRVRYNTDYANFFKDHFEWAVMENESKWYHNEPTQGNVTYEDADAIYDFCQLNDITMRGHCIYWAAEGVVQDWLKALSDSDFLDAVESRMDSAANHFKNKFVHWDVNNEMVNNSYYKDRLGGWIRVWMFQEAHAIDPDCLLFVNDYNVISWGGNLNGYKTLTLDLIANGAPIHGAGVQCHIGSGFDRYAVLSRFDSVAELGLPIWVSEFDVDKPDEYTRADDLEDFHRIAFSHPAVEGILMWGFWEGSHWRDNWWIVNNNWTLNEAGIRYENIMQEWTTNDSNTTDAAGIVNFRGFHGTYDITLTIPSVTVELKTIELEPGETTAEFILEMDVGGPSTCDEVHSLGFTLASDLVEDCYVNFEDLNVLIDYWLEMECETYDDCDGADFEPDGDVDLVDFSTFGLEWMYCNNPQDASCTPNW